MAVYVDGHAVRRHGFFWRLREACLQARLAFAVAMRGGHYVPKA